MCTFKLIPVVGARVHVSLLRRENVGFRAALMGDYAESTLILYRAEAGRTRIECRFVDDSLWLTHAQMAELFAPPPQNVTLHLKAIYAERELDEAATCKEYLQVRSEGTRDVSRSLRNYRLEAGLPKLPPRITPRPSV